MYCSIMQERKRDEGLGFFGCGEIWDVRQMLVDVSERR
jgi:hypothetical protein